MPIPVEIVESLRAKFETILPHLDERAARLLLAAEARSLGHGGIAAVARASGSARSRVQQGVAELEAGIEPLDRVRRAGVESLNRNIKRSQFENLANPDNRAVRGNTFTYLIAALATMVENLRQMLSFYKRKLAIANVTAKNRELPSTFWQSDGPVPGNDPGQRPPD